MILLLQSLIAMIAILFIVLGIWRWTDKRTDLAVWKRLYSHQSAHPPEFHIDMIAALPDPARRYFRYAIEAATPLKTVAEISMTGDFSLGTKADPRYMPMRARQILAAPHGFIWQVRAGGRITISGSDGAADGRSWSRFWLAGLVPVARAGGNTDHARSAFGRYIAEAAIWTPAALLPGNGIEWEYIDDASVRVTVTYRGMRQSVEIFLDASDRPCKVVFQRWSNANAEKEFKLQPFGAYLSDYRVFDGFRLPTRIEAGNFFDTDDYFPFFVANVASVRFHGAPAGKFAK